MMNKKLVCAVSVVFAILMGCSEPDNTVPEPLDVEVKQMEEPKIEEEKNTEAVEEQSTVLANMAFKGALWLDAHDQDFNRILTKKDPQHTATPIFNLFSNAQQALEIMGAKNEFVFNLNNVKASKNKLVKSIDLSTLSYNFKGQKDGATVKEAFDYIQSLPVELAALDSAGNELATAYLSLHQAMSDLGQYFFIKEAFSLDDYAQAETLYNNVKDAFAELGEVKEKFSAVYIDFYKDIQQAKKTLAKAQALVIHYNIMESMESVEGVIKLLKSDSLLVEQLQFSLEQLEGVASILATGIEDSETLHKEFPEESDQAQVKKYFNLFQETIADVGILIKNLDENNEYDFKSNVRRLQDSHQSLMGQYID